MLLAIQFMLKLRGLLVEQSEFIDEIYLLFLLLFKEYLFELVK